MVSPATTRSEDATDGSNGLTLEATIAVEPNSPAGCAVIDGHKAVGILEQNLTFDPRKATPEPDDGTCNTTLTEGEPESDETYVRTDIDEDCFCLVFHEVECIPTFERIHDDKLLIRVLVPHRDALRELVSRLRANGASVSVHGITRSSDDAESSMLINAADVTAKQLEALEVAVETGYYETPREADLEVLADRLSVSKSAVSQRLKAVESKLARKLVDQWSGR